MAQGMERALAHARFRQQAVEGVSDGSPAAWSAQCGGDANVKPKGDHLGENGEQKELVAAVKSKGFGGLRFAKYLVATDTTPTDSWLTGEVDPLERGAAIWS